MECKFLTNGIAIDYFGTVKPCCIFRPTQKYRDNNSIKTVNLSEFHLTSDVIKIKNELAQDRWPEECGYCKEIESQSRQDSTRLNGLKSYSQYNNNDIFLEIRGGSTCNFACQTCWPQASSRVSQFYKQANLSFVSTQDMDWDFDVLTKIKYRLRDIVVLGGEPFYDKNCLKFLNWLQKESIFVPLIIFTNGSMLDKKFIDGYQGKLTIVFSIDAVGLPSEYIRYGSDWKIVKNNYKYCLDHPKVETRINITTSPYNYYYLPDLLSWILNNWPDVVTFNTANTSKNSYFMDESVFTKKYRPLLIDRLNSIVIKLGRSPIEEMQKINAQNALQSITKNLLTIDYNPEYHKQIKFFIQTMDRVKNSNIWDYCPETAEYLDINPTKLA